MPSAPVSGWSAARSPRTRSRGCFASRASRSRPDPSMRDLLTFLVRGLVENPDEVEVAELEEDGDLVYEITVADEDLGRVIGRDGRVANALRSVAKAVAVRLERRVIVDILD